MLDPTCPDMVAFYACHAGLAYDNPYPLPSTDARDFDSQWKTALLVRNRMGWGVGRPTPNYLPELAQARIDEAKAKHGTAEMTDTERHLRTLRTFWLRRFIFNPHRHKGHARWQQERPYLEALSTDMVTWAESINRLDPVETWREAVVCAAACLILTVRDMGQIPGIEVLVFAPEQTTHEGSGSWRLCWEGGPFQWAHGASHDNLVIPARYVQDMTKGDDSWGAEPHFSFDLCYYDPHAGKVRF